MYYVLPSLNTLNIFKIIMPNTSRPCDTNRWSVTLKKDIITILSKSLLLGLLCYTATHLLIK